MLTSITPGSGVTLKLVSRESLPGGGVAFEEDRLAELLGGVLDGGDQVEIILGALGRRHEDMEMAVARLERDRGAHDAAGRGAEAGLAREIGRQRAPPCFAARGLAVGAHGGVRRHALGLAAQHRRAAEGIERRQRGMADHRIGLGDRRPCPPAPPTAANRAAGGSRSASRRGSGSTSPCAGTTARCASGRGRWLARDRQHRADRRLEALLEHARQALALQRVLRLGWHRPRRSRQAPLAPQVVPGVLVGIEQVAGIELQPLGEGLRESLGDLRRGAGRLGLERGRAPGCARSARRPCASSSPAPSAAAARRDTICPGRNAAAVPWRSGRRACGTARRPAAASPVRAPACSTRRRPCRRSTRRSARRPW